MNKKPKTSPWDNVVWIDLSLAENENYTESAYCNLTIGPLQEHQCPPFLLYCYGLIYADDEVCGGENQGYCESYNLCRCINGYYGKECKEYDCFGKHFNDSTVCSGSGNRCISKDKCECNIGLTGDECDEVMQCNGINWNNENVCNGRGSCLEQDKCTCESFGWKGENCDEKITCGGITWDDDLVCNGNGNCIGSDECECTFGYFGDACSEKIHCNGIEFDSSEVCNNSMGDCLLTGVCNCTRSWKWQGPYCTTATKCNFIDWNDPEVCNKKGNCTSLGVCECVYGWEGDFCSFRLYENGANQNTGGRLPVWVSFILVVVGLAVAMLLILGVVITVAFLKNVSKEITYVESKKEKGKIIKVINIELHETKISEVSQK